MKSIWAKIVQSVEEKLMATEFFMRLSDKNCYAPEVLTYPATSILKAERDGKVILYVPVQTCYVMEALGIAEGASFTETAESLKQAVHAVAWEARKAGHGELLFFCKDKQTSDFAERHGFESVNLPCFRLRL